MAKIAFTAGRVSGFKCPPDKKQAFMWDATAPGLGLRATPAGKPAYVFQSVYQGKDLRLTIGSPDAWSIADAQAKARELRDPLHKSIFRSFVRCNSLISLRRILRKLLYADLP